MPGLWLNWIEWNWDRADDKKLTSTLKKLGVNQIPGIEEVNMFKADGNIIHFRNPRVQASIAANTYVVSGAAETKGTLFCCC